MQVVVDGQRNLLGGEAVAHPGEQFAQLVGGEQIEQHQHVGLLGGLVAGDAVVVRLQDPVQALNVAVPLTQSVPVQLLEIGIALRRLMTSPPGEGPDVRPEWNGTNIRRLTSSQRSSSLPRMPSDSIRSRRSPGGSASSASRARTITHTAITLV